MRAVASILAIVCSVIGADAADLKIPVKEFHTRFNNFTRANNIDLRAARVECSTEATTICQYKISSAVAVLVTSDKPNGMASEITVIYASQRDSDAPQGLLAYASLIGVLSPSARPSERGDTIMSLFKGIKESGEKETAELGAVKYVMMRVTGMGLWLIATPAGN